MPHAFEPLGGRDYPRSAAEFARWFPVEAACRAYLAQVRWRAGFRCPACAGRRVWRTARGTARCPACGHQTSATAGTIFAGTRAPLRRWFEVLWALVGEDGVSARAIEEALGLGSYQTAWAWLHKLRRAMLEPAGARLRGVVDVDEAALWGVEAGRGRPTTRLAVAVEVRADATGQVRLTRLPDHEPLALGRFAADCLAADATLRTTAWSADELLQTVGPRRTVVIVPGPAPVALSALDEVAARLEAWCSGTHRSAISQRQLDVYLAEFAFRFNHRADPPGLAFYRLLERALATAPAPYATLVGGSRGVPKAVPARSRPAARLGG